MTTDTSARLAHAPRIGILAAACATGFVAAAWPLAAVHRDDLAALRGIVARRPR